MKKHVLFSIIFFCSGFFSSAVISEHHGENKYVIQIGAFHEVPEKIKNDARQYGELQQEKIADLIRLTVGPFHSRLDAEKRLVDIKINTLMRLYDLRQGLKPLNLDIFIQIIIAKTINIPILMRKKWKSGNI